MGGFFIGTIIGATLYGANSALRDVMKLVYENNPEELAKLKIFGYPIYSWVKFNYLRKDEN